MLQDQTPNISILLIGNVDLLFRVELQLRQVKLEDVVAVQDVGMREVVVVPDIVNVVIGESSALDLL